MFRNPLAARRLGRNTRRHYPPQLETLEERLAPAGYSPTDLGNPVNNANGSFAVAVNDSGQIVASGLDGIGSYLYNPSGSSQGWQPLNPPSGYTQTFPKGINSSGQVLADAETQGGSYGVFLYSNGWTNLNAPSGFQQGLPQGINDSGEIYAATQAGTNRQAVTYTNSQGWQTNLSAPGGANIYNALGINKSGQLLAVAIQTNVFGPYSEFYSYDPNKGWTDLGNLGFPDGYLVSTKVISGAINDSGQAFLDTQLPFSNYVNQILLNNNVDNSTAGFQTLNPPSGYSNPIPSGINNAGQLLVEASTGSGSSTVAHLLLYDPNNTTNTWTDLNNIMPSGITLTGAGGINNNGDIAANGSDGHIYLIQPDAAPMVTANPTNQTVTAGQPATFTASASGVPTPAVQWQYSKDGTNWANVGGASTSTTLYFSNVPTAWNNYQVRAVFNNNIGSPAISNAATLTVQTLPVINSGNSATFTVGQNGSFTVTATGSPTPTLSVSGRLPNGVTFTDHHDGTATLAGAPAAGTQRTYQFTINASNGAGTEPQTFTLTVNPAPASSSSSSASPSSSAPPALNVPSLLAMFDSLLGGVETVNADGTATITDSLFGIALLVAHFDHSGHLVSVSLFGIDVTFLFG